MVVKVHMFICVHMSCNIGGISQHFGRTYHHCFEGINVEAGEHSELVARKY